MQQESINTEALFNDISSFISQSRSLLQAGQMMELLGLDDQVRTLCEAVLKLSDEDREIHADRLQQLLQDLTKLGDEMAAQRDQLAEQIRGVPNFKKASVAYRVVGAIKGKEDDDEEEDNDE